MADGWTTVTGGPVGKPAKNLYQVTEKLRVPEGLLYRTTIFDPAGDLAGVSMTFAPSPPLPAEKPPLATAGFDEG
jgi:hypothetical protein